MRLEKIQAVRRMLPLLSEPVLDGILGEQAVLDGILEDLGTDKKTPLSKGLAGSGARTGGAGPDVSGSAGPVLCSRPIEREPLARRGSPCSAGSGGSPPLCLFGSGGDYVRGYTPELPGGRLGGRSWPWRRLRHLGIRVRAWARGRI